MFKIYLDAFLFDILTIEMQPLYENDQLNVIMYKWILSAGCGQELI